MTETNHLKEALPVVGGLIGMDGYRWVVLTNDACDSIEEMFKLCELIREEQGWDAYHKAVRSLGHCLAAVFARRGFGHDALVFSDRIIGDGKSTPSVHLTVQERGFVFGMIWHSRSGEWSLNS